MKVLFVTGKLAEPLLRETLAGMKAPFDHEVAVLGISVAALMTADWVGRFLEVGSGTDLVLLPGEATVGVPKPVRRRVTAMQCILKPRPLSAS